MSLFLPRMTKAVAFHTEPRDRFILDGGCSDGMRLTGRFILLNIGSQCSG